MEVSLDEGTHLGRRGGKREELKGEMRNERVVGRKETGDTRKEKGEKWITVCVGWPVSFDHC